MAMGDCRSSSWLFVCVGLFIPWMTFFDVGGFGGEKVAGNGK
jgi:hypothetical protein